MHPQEQARSRLFTRRAALVAGGQALLLGALVGRMYYLQVVESEQYTLQAEENRVSLRLIAPLRGRILDRFGTPLAVNVQTYRVIVTPEQTDDLKATLKDLARMISLSDNEIAAVLRESQRRRAFMPLPVRENLSWEQVAQIEVNSPDLPGVSIEVGQTRYYPLGGSTAHILGYVAQVSESEQTGDPVLELPGFTIGKLGVEKQYDLGLRGRAGARQVEVNAVGRVVRELARDEGETGQDLTVTLDAGLQQFVEQRLASELSASAVVLDVHTGEVLALGSTPTFDPNAFNRSLSAAQWRSWMNDPLRPLANKAIAGQYAPGSTFKIVVALAALKSGLQQTHQVFCPGHLSLGTATFHCWKKEGHGTLSMIDGIKNSCDVYFYDVAHRTGIDAIAEMARKFGLGQAEGLDMPGEKNGLIPDRDWKKATTGEAWQQGETLVAGIGQGFILATPLQLAVMVSRLANGGIAVVPHITRPANPAAAAADIASRRFASMGIPADMLKVVAEGMNRVTNDARGTAYRDRITQVGMEMAGKTGTSQVRRITMSERLIGVKKNEQLPWPQRDHALFVGFAPVATPRYAVAIVVEHGGAGSAIAGPIARDILLETQTRDPSRALQRLAGL
jgi:penicillin-binding protein 2